jgi:hypothetical protein
MYGGFDHADPPEIGFHSGGRVCLSNEDLNISDRNNEDAGRVFSSQNPEVILRDDGEARIIEDAHPMAMVSLMLAKADPSWIRVSHT